MKKILRYIYLYIMVSVTMTMVSCEDLKFGDAFLQKPPSSDVTIDTVFNDAEYARRVLWYSYQQLPFGLPIGTEETMHISTMEGLTDLSQSSLTYSDVNTYYYTGTYNAKMEQEYAGKSQYKGNHWVAIRNAWLVVANVDKVPNMDAEEKARLKAEAKTLVALYYSDMFRHYGALPIVDHVLSANELMPARATVEQTVNFIVRLLDEAIATDAFPWKLSDDERPLWYGRMTKASAMALKTRVLLFAASPLFNADQPYLDGEAASKKMTWYGGYDKNRWKLAADACKEFFDAVGSNGFYKLVQAEDASGVYAGYEDNYRYAFRAAYFDRGTTETLISVHRNIFMAQDIKQLDTGTRWGAHLSTVEYLDMFPDAEGNDLDWEQMRNNREDIFVNRDPRLYETFQVTGEERGGQIMELFEEDPNDKVNYPKGAHWGNNWRLSLDDRGLRGGLFLRKWYIDGRKGAGFENHITQWTNMRVAEVYLNYAEALNEYNDGPTNEAYEMVNAVRARVGLNGLKRGMNKEKFRAAVLKERACEFGYEEVRIFDLIRWKRADIFGAAKHLLHIYRHNDTKQYKYDVQSYEDTPWKSIWWEKGSNGFSAKWYLSAFPADEVNKGYGLIQNPGWE